MVLKRFWSEGGSGEEGSDIPNRESKSRINGFIGVGRGTNESCFQELAIMMEPFIRNCVSEEVGRAINSYQWTPFNQIGSSEGPRTLQLHFDDKLPSTLFTGCRVEKEDSTPLKVVLRDSRSKKVVTSGPLSSVKVTIVALDGDFNKDGQEDWTAKDFSNRTIRQREGKRPLVTGTLVLTLKEGIACIEVVSFTDNSSWIRSGKFRLGAIPSEGGIREGISNAFKVKDHRGESYKKHHPPSSDDEVWRLEKIAKDGASHKRLASQGIYNVKGLLRLYVTHPSLLRKILGCKIRNKAWNTIIEHATDCPKDPDELYQYKAADGTILVLNSIYEVVGASFDSEHYLSSEMLNTAQKSMVDNLKQFVYNNLDHLVPIGDQSFVPHPLLLSNLPSTSYCSPGIQNVSFQVEQDQMGTHMHSDHMKIAPTHTHGVQENNQFKCSGVGTSHQMDVNPILSNSFFITDLYDETPNSAGYIWDSPRSLEPLGFTNHQLLDDNYQAETSAWQGNGYFLAPNQAFGVVSSDMGIGIPSNLKRKASWSKIRAVIKWRMVISSCQKNGKASKCRF